MIQIAGHAAGSASILSKVGHAAGHVLSLLPEQGIVEIFSQHRQATDKQACKQFQIAGHAAGPASILSKLGHAAGQLAPLYARIPPKTRPGADL